MGNIFNFGGLKLDSISGLDPAGPCFEGKLGDIRLPENGIRRTTNFILDKHIFLGLTKWGLNADAAEFVDNYHTDGENYGTYISMGDMDFFIGEIDGRPRQQYILQRQIYTSQCFRKWCFRCQFTTNMFHL